MLYDVNVVPLCELVIEWNQRIILITTRFIHADRVMTQCIAYERECT